MHLYIGYKNYSSWSLRPWLAMKVAGIKFDETVLPFYHTDQLSQLANKHSIPATVPFLETELEGKSSIIWDSLAIMEFLAEQYPQAKLWPENPNLRGLARSAASEMHSGFLALRGQFFMNCRTSVEMAPTPESQRDLNRLAEIWQKFAEFHVDGPFLCGHFTIIDAMFAPVMWRVKGYGLFVSEAFSAWSEAMLALPEMQEWLSSAQQEEWVIQQYEVAAS